MSLSEIPLPARSREILTSRCDPVWGHQYHQKEKQFTAASIHHFSFHPGNLLVHGVKVGGATSIC